MSIAKLTKLVPPPNKPISSGTGQDWAKVEKEIGTRLPQDYKDFIAAYGSGSFAQFYTVFNPFAESKWVRLADRVNDAPERLQDIHDDEPDFLPYDIFPKSPGILNWGNDGNGNDYFWLIEGDDPDAWPVIAFDCRGSGAEKHDCTLTGYLLGVMEKKIKPLATDFPRKECYRFLQPDERA